MKNFIEKIQNSDEQTKKIWLFIFSAVSMIVVISLWLVYLNSSIGKTSEISAENQSETGFFQVFKTGVKVVGLSISQNSKDLIYKLMGGKTITIE